MIIYLGSDHQGFELKEYLQQYLQSKGYEVIDLGNAAYDANDHYPQYAAAVAKKISLEYDKARGIVICGSGVGVDIVANKFRHVRCALVCSPDQAFDSRNDDDTNVLALPARYVSREQATRTTMTWLHTPFSKEVRHQERLDQVARLEQELLKPVIDV